MTSATATTNMSRPGHSQHRLDKLDELILRQIVNHVTQTDAHSGTHATLLPLHRLALTCRTFYRLIWKQQTEGWWRDTLAAHGFIAVRQQAASDLSLSALDDNIQVRAARQICKHQDICEPRFDVCPADQGLTSVEVTRWAQRQKELERERNKVPKFLKAPAEWLGPVKRKFLHGNNKDPLNESAFLKLNEDVISIAQAKQIAIPFNIAALAAVLQYGQVDTRHCNLVDHMFTNPPLEQIEVAICLTSKLHSKLKGYHFTTFTIQSKQGVTLQDFLDAWGEHMWDGVMREAYLELGWLDGNPDPFDCEILWDLEKSLYDDKFAHRVKAKRMKWWPLFHFVNGGRMMMMVDLTH